MKLFIFCLFLFLSFNSFSKLNVLTTTTNLENIAALIGGEKIDVFSLSRGAQDPHYIEAKPSFMVKASKADLLISMGLDLEIGWLPLIIRGARNPKIKEGASGSLVAGNFIQALEKPEGNITRADGDVHPDGNPHFLLDPMNAIIVAQAMSDKFKALDSQNAETFEKNFEVFKEKILEKMSAWKKRVKEGQKVITYHKTLTYFFNRFNVKNVEILEPKPGIPPSASHIMKVMKMAKDLGVKKVIVENFFDPTVANRVARDVKGLKVFLTPVAVDGDPNIKDIFSLYEKLISILEE